MKEPKDIFLYLSSPNSPKQSHSQCILLLIAAHKDTVLVMFSCTTAQHTSIYCTNTVQTVPSATELYLQ